jgi:hypothetical protein
MITVGGSNNIGTRLYRSQGDRRKAVAQLKKDGFNYFIGFNDEHPTHKAGLTFGKAQWASLIAYERDI